MQVGDLALFTVLALHNLYHKLDQSFNINSPELGDILCWDATLEQNIPLRGSRTLLALCFALLANKLGGVNRSSSIASGSLQKHRILHQQLLHEAPFQLH